MKILILSVGIGSGHNRASDALHKACKLYFNNVESKWVDTLKYTPGIFRILYADSYMLYTNKTPLVWNIIYQLAINKAGEPLKELAKAFDQVAFPGVKRMINNFQPDAVICTHFFPANIILTQKGGKRSRLPVYVVITDYDAHVFHINHDATGYFVGSEQVKSLLANHGYPKEKISVTGIPIDPQFSQYKDISQLKASFGLRNDIPTILFTSGGYGAHHMREALGHILRIERDFQLLMIAGRNKKIQAEMQQVARNDKRIHIYGFVNNMHDFMKVSDFIVAKSGGLTVAESIASNLPMVIHSPTPGHEERNCDFLLESGAAIKAQSFDLLDYKIRLLLDHPEKLQTMRDRMRNISQPEPAKEIIKQIIGSSPGEIVEKYSVHVRQGKSFSSLDRQVSKDQKTQRKQAKPAR